MVGGQSHEAMRVLRTLQDISAFERSAAEETTTSDASLDAVRVLVRGQFVRKRKLS